MSLSRCKISVAHIGVLGTGQADLHAAATGRHGDDFIALAAALGAGCHGRRHGLCGSSRIAALAVLLGLPIPLDRLGAVLRYQTDHDEAERATSCGPRTSRLMVKVLAKESASLRTIALSKRAKLAGINRSAARSPDWCGIASLSFRLCGLANPLGPPEVKTRTLLVETRPTSAQIVGRSLDARNRFSLHEERIRSWRIEKIPQQSIIPT
jgi:hypothetical protein